MRDLRNFLLRKKVNVKIEPVEIPPIVQVKDEAVELENFQCPWMNASLEDVEKALRADALVSLVMWTMLFKCFNTETGKVALFFTNVRTPRATYPMMVGHWSLWQRVMIQCYTGCTRKYRKEHMQSAFGLFVVANNFSKKKFAVLRRTTGAEAMTKPRILEQGHFLISFDLFQKMAMVLKNHTVETLLSKNKTSNDGWCKDTCITIEDLKEYENMNVSSYKMSKTPQSKFRGDAYFPTGGLRDPVYDSLTPSFGIPWSTAQIERLNRYLGYEDPRHFHTFYTRAGPPEPMDVIRAKITYREDDRHLRPPSNHGFQQKKDKKALEKVFKENNLSLPGRGRPSGSIKAIVKKKQLELEQIQIERRKRKNKKKVRCVGRGSLSILKMFNPAWKDKKVVMGKSLGKPKIIKASVVQNIDTRVEIESEDENDDISDFKRFQTLVSGGTVGSLSSVSKH